MWRQAIEFPLSRLTITGNLPGHLQNNQANPSGSMGVQGVDTKLAAVECAAGCLLGAKPKRVAPLKSKEAQTLHGNVVRIS